VGEAGSGVLREHGLDQSRQYNQLRASSCICPTASQHRKPHHDATATHRLAPSARTGCQRPPASAQPLPAPHPASTGGARGSPERGLRQPREPRVLRGCRQGALAPLQEPRWPAAAPRLQVAAPQRLGLAPRGRPVASEARPGARQPALSLAGLAAAPEERAAWAASPHRQAASGPHQDQLLWFQGDL